MCSGRMTGDEQAVAASAVQTLSDGGASGSNRRHRLAGLLMMLLVWPATSRSEVPRELVSELSPIVEEALHSEDAVARAWAVRALALQGGRSVRRSILNLQDDTELDVRLSVGLALVAMGRDDGLDVLASAILSADAASRVRIFERHVRHLAAESQGPLLVRLIANANDEAALQQLLETSLPVAQPGALAALARAESDWPERLPERLVNVLSRSAGMHHLGETAEWLSRSSRPDARRQAVRAAETGGDAADQAVLQRLLSDTDASVSNAAAFALAPHGVAAAQQRLISMARGSEDADERLRALAAVRDSQRPLLALQELQDILIHASDDRLRQRAGEAIGALGAESAVQLLTEMLNRDVYEDRLAAIGGLGFTRRESVVPMLAEVLLGGGGVPLRLRAAEALGHLAHPSVVPPLVEALDRERSAEVTVAVIAALAASATEQAVWPLTYRLNDSNVEVVLAALRGLETLGDHQARGPVETLATTHRDVTVRWRATLVLLTLDPEAGPIRLGQALDRPPEGFIIDIDALAAGLRQETYRRLCSHASAPIRLQALTRLLGQPDGGRSELRQLTSASTPMDVRQSAIGRLTALREAVDLPLFLDLVESSSRALREQALEAIVEMANPETEGLLRTTLEASDLRRRVMAVYGLWHLAAEARE